MIINVQRVSVALLIAIVCVSLSTSLLAQQDSATRYELKDKKPGEDKPTNLIDLKDPPNIRTEYKYDPATGNYLEVITIGGKSIGSPRVLTLTE